jgi:N-acetylglucosaminyl-diphospho-decaprenol L-rhamnosyltransferase
VILNYRTWPLVDRALDALQMLQTRPEVRVTVVDNASGTRDASLERRYPWVHFRFNETNLGFAGGNNASLAVSAAEYVLLQNSDAFPTVTDVDMLVRVLDGDPSAAAAAPALAHADGSPQVGDYGRSPRIRRWFAELSGLAALPLLGWTGFWGRTLLTTDPAPRSVDWVSGACLMLRSAAVRQVGLLSEEYFMYMEDVEWCERARRQGWRVLYVPAVKVTHLLGASGGPVSTRWISAILGYVGRRHSPLAVRGLALVGAAGFAWRSLASRLRFVRGSGDPMRPKALMGYARGFMRHVLAPTDGVA